MTYSTFPIEKFQSLIGRLKTGIGRISGGQAENPVFQSLIGRLKTWFPLPGGTSTMLFQSLIGRLKTSNDGREQGDQVAFQSLIGRLKTPATIPRVW